MSDKLITKGMMEAEPPKGKPRSVSPAKQKEMAQKIMKILKKGKI